MATKKVFIEAGHGGSDPGAVGYVTESKKAIKVVNFTYDYLKANYTVSLKKDITDDSTTTICKRANNWGADLFISIHFNAGGGDGFEALVYGPSTESLGDMFCKYAVKAGQNSRGTKYRPDLNVLKSTNMKAVLCEVAFVDTWKDIEDWNEDSELKKMAEYLAKATADYLNLPLKKKGLVDCKDFKVEVVSKTLAVRKKPASTAKKLTTIKKGEIYTIVKKTSDGKWGLLKAGPIVGSSYVNLATKYVKKK